MFSLPRLLLPALGLAAAVGCGISGSTKSPPSGHTPATAARSLIGPVDLNEVTSAGLEAAIREQKGKVVLIDAWFLGCGPCVKKFPHVVELANKYGPDGLTVMSVDVFEDEAKMKDKVLAFLKDKGAAFPNFLLKENESDAFMTKYDITGTPAVVLFDRTGKRVDLPKRPTDDEVEAAIRTALRQNEV